jgi:hypothetical protein
MADMRRRSPEPPQGAPQIQFKPGIANETLRELAPLLALRLAVEAITEGDPPWPERSWNKYSPSLRTTPSPPSQAASASLLAYWLTGTDPHLTRLTQWLQPA